MRYDDEYYPGRGHMDRFRVVKVDDTQDIQYHQIEGFSDEKFEKVSIIYPHGFSSHPVDEANLWAFAHGGARDRLTLIGGEHPDKRAEEPAEGRVCSVRR